MRGEQWRGASRQRLRDVSERFRDYESAKHRDCVNRVKCGYPIAALDTGVLLPNAVPLAPCALADPLGIHFKRRTLRVELPLCPYGDLLVTSLPFDL